MKLHEKYMWQDLKTVRAKPTNNTFLMGYFSKTSVSICEII